MRWRLILLLFPCIGILLMPAYAADTDKLISRQEEVLELDELERAAKNAGATAEYGVSLDDGLTGLLETGAEALGGIVRTALKSGVVLMVIVLLCGFGETVIETVGKSKLPVVPLAGTLAITSVAAVDVHAMLGLGRSTIDGMTSFANVLLPTIAAATAATGAVTGAAVRQMAAALFSDLLVNLINSLLIPLLYGYLAACIAYAAEGNEGVKRVGALLKWAVTTVLTTVMLAFVGYLSVSGVVAGSADAATIKATKFAISGTIPVVGGILSDAAETILASAGVLRGTVGVFGTVTVLGLCLIPVLRLAVHYLMYKLVAAVSAAGGSGRISTLVDQIGSAFGLMLGMTGACCLLLLVTLVSSITAVSS